MEDQVYLCTWSRSKKSWKVSTTTSPIVSVEAPTYTEAEEQLCEAIRDRGGAMIPVLEFVPPLPRSTREAKYSVPELYLIYGDDRFETSAPKATPSETPEEREARSVWYDSFYERPVCRKCLGPTAPRNHRPIEATHTPGSHDSAFGYIAGRVRLTIVSEEFLALLTEEERLRLEIRPVVRPRSKRRFFEVLGPGGPRPVAVAGLPVAGWRCGACGRAVWGYFNKDFAIREFIAASDLPDPLPGLFTIGVSHEVQLCATAGRWAELVGRKGTRGMTSSMLGVVSDDELVRDIELQVLHGDRT